MKSNPNKTQKTVSQKTVSLTVRVTPTYKNKLLEETQTLGITMSDLVWEMLDKAEKIKQQREQDFIAEITAENLAFKNLEIIKNRLTFLVIIFLVISFSIYIFFYFEIIPKNIAQIVFISFVLYFTVIFLKNVFTKEMKT